MSDEPDKPEPPKLIAFIEARTPEEALSVLRVPSHVRTPATHPVRRNWKCRLLVILMGQLRGHRWKVVNRRHRLAFCLRCHTRNAPASLWR